MARLYGEVVGAARSPATRIGHREIWGHIRGWHVGVRVSGHLIDGEDIFVITASSGSSGGGREIPIGTVKLENGEPSFFPSDVPALRAAGYDI